MDDFRKLRDNAALTATFALFEVAELMSVIDMHRREKAEASVAIVS
jgi:hypothetical protein